jgi:hypothetical protein
VTKEKKVFATLTPAGHAQEDSRKWQLHFESGEKQGVDEASQCKRR